MLSGVYAGVILFLHPLNQGNVSKASSMKLVKSVAHISSFSRIFLELGTFSRHPHYRPKHHPPQKMLRS